MRNDLISVFSLLRITAAHAEKMTLSHLSNADEKYIQQGWPDRVASCALDEIEFAKSIHNQKNVVITFDENITDIKFYFKDTKFTRICGEKFMTEITPGQKPLVLPY